MGSEGHTSAPRDPGDARIVLLMGVSAAGKTTLGRLLSERLGWSFLEGDDFHPEANVKKMRSGIPLGDEDRAPWIEALRSAMRERLARGESAIVACSALKQSYRDRLVIDGRVHVAWLDLPREALERRLTERQGHFMPAALLDSQLAALEKPRAAFRIDATLPPEEIATRICDAFGL